MTRRARVSPNHHACAASASCFASPQADVWAWRLDIFGQAPPHNAFASGTVPYLLPTITLGWAGLEEARGWRQQVASCYYLGGDIQAGINKDGLEEEGGEGGRKQWRGLCPRGLCLCDVTVAVNII